MGLLKEKLLEREAVIAARKYPDLKLKKKDPIKYEMLFTQLLGLVQNSRESARQISASPVVREMGECVFSLFTPEGDSVCFSNGLLLHTASLGGTVKWMLKNNYEEEVGIHDGDYFMNNDPHIGGAHSPDQATVTPIFYKGEIVGWAGGLIHVLETGATEPGGASPTAISRYDEGIFWPCVKVAEKETLKKDLENIVIRGTRVPLYWLLDSRATMAGDRLIKEGVVRLIEQFGLDFYLEAVYEFIEDTRQAARKKLRSVLFPGKYSHMAFLGLPNKDMPMRMARDHNIRIPCETTITPDGELYIDLDGASPPGNHPNNSSLPCLIGNLLTCLIQYVFYDLKPNQGIFQAFETNVPPSVVNPPLSAACALWTTAIASTAINTINVSRAYYSMGYREEVTAGFFVGAAMMTGGLDQYGRPFGAMQFEAMCAGTGATAVGDGLRTCYAAMNPEGDLSDVEVWEKILPQMWLGRGIKVDSGGFGKYQGGSALESLYCHEHSDAVSMGGVGLFFKVHSIYGLMGGYPPICNYHWTASGTNVKQTIEERRPIPHSAGSDPTRPEWADMIQATSALLPSQVASAPVARYDLWDQFTNGGGGFGDPLERDPTLVKRDIENDVISRHVAEVVYGVAIHSTTREVDPEKTTALRTKIRAARKKRGLPTREYVARERQKVLAGDLPPMAVSCLNECMANSKKFTQQFREFWDLDPDFVQIVPKRSES